jgi:hypothetical protein
MHASSCRPLLRRRALAAVAALAVAACAGSGVPRTPADRPGLAPLAFELLGVAELAKTTPLDQAPVGGLSALAWQPATGLWYALSDDAGDEEAPPRFFTLRLELADGRLGDGDVEVVGTTPLADAGGRPFAPHSVDPEGMVLSSRGTLWISSEGAADRGIPPWVREVGLDGVTRRELALPEHYLPAGEGDARRGVHHNLAFESLTLTPDGARLIAATEAALAQDGPPATFGGPSPARVLVFDAATGRVVAEHVYVVEPVPRRAAAEGGAEIAGLVEMLALEDGRLLALERAFVAGHGNTVRLYETSLAGAGAVSGEARLPRDVRPMPKRLLLDFADLGVPLDNVEGMALGPALPDGRRTLVLVADDNFSRHQRTLFYAFAISGGGVPPAPPSPPPVEAPIAAIQGAGHLSPLAGRRVAEVAGVVTAVVAPLATHGEAPRGGGFWMEDPTGDGDPATSEGLWVSEPDGPGVYAVAAGDAVRVSGRVAEVGRPGELTTTTLLAAPGEVRVVSRGNPLPGPRRIGGAAAGGAGGGGDCPPRPVIDDDGLTRFEPAEDGIDFWESLEGMRVELVEPLVVGPTSRFGEIAVVAAACAPAEGRTARGGLLVAADDFHPERLLVDDRLVAGPPQVAVGDRFLAPLVGVVDYSFANFKLLNPEPLPAVAPLAAAAADATPLAGDDEHLTVAGLLTVATLNVENLSVRDPPAKLAALAEVVVAALGAPAIVALQEVQDDSGRADDGTVTAATTLDRLVAAIAAAGGPGYVWRQVDPEDNADGGAPGGNIRVAFLLDPARARPVDRGAAGPRDGVAVVASPGGGPALSLSPGRVAPERSRLPRRRGRRRAGGARAVAQAAGDRGRGRRSAALPGQRPLPLEGRRRPAVRLGAAATPGHRGAAGGAGRGGGGLRRRAAGGGSRRRASSSSATSTTSPSARRSPRSTAVGLVNLVDRLSPEDRYTYVYEGNSQVLDHVLASPALAAAEAGVDAVHLHADFPPGRRASDHDPVVARFRLPPAP